MVSFEVGGKEHIETQANLAFSSWYGHQRICGPGTEPLRDVWPLGDMPPEVSGIFKITNARSRNEIITELKKKKYAGSCNLFWNSSMKEVGRLDELRNRIVHWHSVAKVGGTEQAITMEAVLSPGNFAANSPTEMSIPDLRDFCARCDIFSRALNILYLHWMKPEHEIAQSLLDIFQRELVYPLPPGHPLSLSLEAGDSPPPASPL
jgi:hypothetical protein